MVLSLDALPLDLGRRRVNVRRRFYKGDLAPPKSRYGKRTVPLSAGLGKELWLRRGNAGDEALVFPARHGGIVDASTAFRTVQAAGKAGGIDGVGPHTLRHSCATRLFRNGLNAKQVQLWLGHHSAAFTLATYVHLLADDLPEVAFLDELADRWRYAGQQTSPIANETTPTRPRQNPAPRADLSATPN